MHALFFDMRAKPGHMPHYFDHVARLRPHLDRHKGLLYLERFRPLDDADAILSHQHWADDAAIAGWRREPQHRLSQTAGRHEHFTDYRIRVGVQVWHLPDPPDPTGSDAGRFVVAAYGGAAAPDGRVYESLIQPGRFLTLAAADRADTARGLAVRAHAAGAAVVRVFAIARDYGMTDRAEAPG